MSSSRRHRRLERNARARARTIRLNIVSLIDVFAVLVMFLLVSASLNAARLNVISLNLPSPDQTVAEQDEVPLQLTVTVRENGISVSDRNGAVRQIENTPDGYNIQLLADVLIEVKKAAPKEQTLTLLLEPDIDYDSIVKVMDAARTPPAEARANGLPKELFPQISIGDAAPAGRQP
ncbi:biopolymer transporter ExbD [Sinimarinibacterium sp. NLF-5-8]|uniref:ExbD/TolR family protein n=1 Tax=Sinimarinibacterium sp. NLF-5-8 TaxID=2698684 RepID=UPI00137BD54D|nr:biopolymer transporter ExbD [Sinimarinibacterium sp. NLF-5-8]QHS09222.1 biopolymer transporter ExbD [Sinimarinibacterium sp. NLF-5-8]